jgi:hypothetical protein
MMMFGIPLGGGPMDRTTVGFAQAPIITMGEPSVAPVNADVCTGYPQLIRSRIAADNGGLAQQFSRALKQSGNIVAAE